MTNIENTALTKREQPRTGANKVSGGRTGREVADNGRQGAVAVETEMSGAGGAGYGAVLLAPPDGDLRRDGSTDSSRRADVQPVKAFEPWPGMSRLPEYRVWKQMRRRCNPRRKHSSGSRLYLQRGITVCSEWQQSFPAFYASVGPRPTSQHSLDRIDNDKGYEPGNVRWATKKEQSRNRSVTVFITANGVTRSLPEWAELLGVNRSVIRGRLAAGWSPALAVTQPVIAIKDRPRAKRGHLIKFEGGN